MTSAAQPDPEPQTRMTGAAIVLKALQDQGVEVVFGYPGGAVLPIYDELFTTNAVRHILVRHEQGAVHAAEGYARSTGKVGVVLVTSGPGATNAVTGLTDALMDSIPIVCLTGQVPTHLIGNDAFQEADTTGITRPCTKHNYLVKSVDNLADIMHEAFHVAARGRPGPVVIDLPKDVLFADGAVPGALGAAPYRLPAPHHPGPGRGGTGGRSHRECRTPGVLRRWRPGQLRARGEPAADRVRADDRLPGDAHPDGTRGPYRRPTGGSWACSGCTAPTRPTSRCTTAT